MSTTQLWQRLFVGGIEDAEAISNSNPLEIANVITLPGDIAEPPGARTTSFYRWQGVGPSRFRSLT